MKFLNDKGDNIEELTSFYLDVGSRILFNEEKNNTWAIHYLLLGDSINPNHREIRSALVKAYIAIGRADLAEPFK
jgi:hypothetical protein